MSAGPLCTFFLASLGADVVAIEDVKPSPSRRSRCATVSRFSGFGACLAFGLVSSTSHGIFLRGVGLQTGDLNQNFYFRGGLLQLTEQM